MTDKKTLDEKQAAIDREYHAVYGWSVNEKGQCVPPTPIYPKAVRDRVKWATWYMNEAGLTYAGAFDAVMANNEERDRYNFEFGGEWLPVSDEFRAWRDEPFMGSIRAMQIALALLYGDPTEEDGDSK